MRWGGKAAHSSDIPHREDADVTYFCPFFQRLLPRESRRGVRSLEVRTAWRPRGLNRQGHEVSIRGRFHQGDIGNFGLPGCSSLSMNASVIVKTARQPDPTVFSERELEQPLVSPITIGNVLCCGATAASPGRAIDVVERR